MLHAVHPVALVPILATRLHVLTIPRRLAVKEFAGVHIAIAEFHCALAVRHLANLIEDVALVADSNGEIARFNLAAEAIAELD